MDADVAELKRVILDAKEMYIVRRNAISDLARNGDGDVLGTILSVRGDHEKIIRRKVAEVLDDFDDDRARAALCEFLSDPDDDVRRNAIRSLKKNGNAACLTDLENATEDKSWFVKRAAEDVFKALKEKFPDGPAAPLKPLGKPRERRARGPAKPVVRQRMPAERLIPKEPKEDESAEPEKKEKEPVRLTATAAAVLTRSEGAPGEDLKNLSDLQAEIKALRGKHREMLDRQDIEAAKRAKEAQSLKSPDYRIKKRPPRRPERKKSSRTRTARREKPALKSRAIAEARAIREKAPPARTVEPARRDRGMKKTCPSCGAKVKEHHRVCLFCGHTFGRTARERAKREIKRGLGAPRRPEKRGLAGKFMLVLLSGGPIVVDRLADVVGASRGLPRKDAIQKLTGTSGIISDDLQPAEVRRFTSILDGASIEYFVQPSDNRHATPQVESIRRGKVDSGGPDFILQNGEKVKASWDDVLLVTCGLIRPGGSAFKGDWNVRTRSLSTRFVMDFFFREPYLIARIVRKTPNLGAMQRMIHRRKEDYFEQLADQVVEHGMPGRISHGIRVMARDGFRGNYDELSFESEVEFTNHGLWLLEVLEYDTARGKAGRIPHLAVPAFRVSENPEHSVWRSHVRERRKHRDYRDIVRKDHRRDRSHIGWGDSNDLLKWTNLLGGGGQETAVRVMAFIVFLIVFFGALGAMCR